MGMCAKHLLTYLTLTLAACNNGDIGQLPGGLNYGALVIVGNNTVTTQFWDNATTSFKPGPPLTDAAGSGAHAFSITKGPHTGRLLIIHGSANGSTSIYDKASQIMIPGPIVNATIGTIGSHSFLIRAGTHAGKQLVILTGTTQTAMYDPATNTFSAGPALPAVPGAHSMNFYGTISGCQIIALGAGSGNISRYYPNSHSFSAGPAAASPGFIALYMDPHHTPGRTLMATVGTSTGALYAEDFVPLVVPAGAPFWQELKEGVHWVKVKTGTYAGQHIGFTGGSVVGTIRIDANYNNYPGPSYPLAAGPGGHAFGINAGPRNGSTLHILGGNTANTAYFDPAAGVFLPGPALPVAAGAGAFSISLGP